jgi:tetratricopeptide (TPR) repeat protein
VNAGGEVIGIAVSRGLKKRRFTYAVPADMISRLQPAAPGSWAGELSPSRERYVEGARHLWDGRFERALGLFEESVRLDPAGSEAHFLLGYCYQNLGRFYDAIGAYRQAARLNPGNSEAQYLLGIAYSKLLCFQDAAESFEKVLLQDPEDFRAHYKLGYAYSRLGWQEEATVAFKRAITARCTMVSPDDLACSENALLGLSEILDAFRQYNWSEAQAANVHYQRGLTYAVMARMDLALKEHRALKELNRTQAARLLQLINPE